MTNRQASRALFEGTDLSKAVLDTTQAEQKLTEFLSAGQTVKSVFVLPILGTSRCPVAK